MPWNQLCSCGHREAVVLVTLDKPTRQCGRSPFGSIDEISFSLSLYYNFCFCFRIFMLVEVSTITLSDFNPCPIVKGSED